jgi:Fe-S-cluster-containing dehydrogenase component
MTSLTGPVNAPGTKATKCTLCNGNPECVAACPTGALKYVPWADKTKDVPPRIVVPMTIQSAVADSCAKCH